MKKIFSWAIKFTLPILFFSTSLVYAQQPSEQSAASSVAEQINSYRVLINVNQDSSMKVTEEIRYDFGVLERHGIFRNIPYKYQTSTGKFNLRLTEFSVTNENGEAIPFDKSRDGNDIVLKIGDADKTITGENFYRISYIVKRAINYFDDHEELYWNTIGDQWSVPINYAYVEVKMPTKIKDSLCFTGPTNSTAKNCDTALSEDGTAVSVSSEASLPAGNGLTVVVSVPQGSIIQPAWDDRLMDFALDNWILFIPLIVFAVMYMLWRRYGRDGKGRGTIVAQYEPPQGLSPLYLGTLVDGKLDNKDLSSEIIYLATLGYLRIEKLETTSLLVFKGTDYKLHKLKPADDKLANQTKAFMNALFAGPDSVALSDFKDNTEFAKALLTLKSEVYKELVSEGYYKKNPQTVLVTSIGIAIPIVAILFFFGVSSFGFAGVVAGLASAVIVIVFALLMPARTEKGAEAKELILGLKNYLSVAEKDRLDFHNAPSKNPETFEKLLPFAMALGVEQQWAKQFQDIYKSQPNWYSNSTGNVFSAGLLSSSVGDFSSSLQSAVVSVTTSSSGGSGFSGGGSGGGGGGGGGGSW